jgi:hypothetical protein
MAEHILGAYEINRHKEIEWEIECRLLMLVELYATQLPDHEAKVVLSLVAELAKEVDQASFCQNGVTYIKSKAEIATEEAQASASNDEPEKTTQHSQQMLDRLESIKAFMEFLAEAVKAKGIEFDAMALPITKAQLLNELNTRYPKKFKIKDEAFEPVWKAAKSAGICDIKYTDSKKGENFLKSISLS